MEEFKEIIEREEHRLKNIAAEMRATLAEEQNKRRETDREISELKQQKLETNDWREKQEIDDRILSCRQRQGMRHCQDPKVLRNPYFGVLELADDDLGDLSYCFGSRSFFDRNSRILVLDWREAPISRLYYEYERGEDYDEDIRGRERSGIVRVKRQVDSSDGVLRKIAEDGYLLVCDKNGEWRKAGASDTAVSRKEESSDHRLPEITALISGDQFRAITHPESNTVLLQGGAGSGKTTVGLHRIAYLVYQDPERFKPGRILVVMFNRSLQRYISRALPELGVEGVQIETYHGWAGKLFRLAKTRITYSPDQPPPAVTRFKKHAVVLSLIDRYLDTLLEKSRDWFLEQLEQQEDPEIGQVRSLLTPFKQFEQFYQALDSHPFFIRDNQPDARKKLRARLLDRLNDHETDLHAALCDQELLNEMVKGSPFEGDTRLVSQIAEWQTMLRDKQQTDFADTGILLWLMQRKGAGIARPDYAHIMVDEAQDLSEVELATLLYAADKAQSVTICGDMAQKIKSDVSFANAEGFTGFVQDLQKRAGNKNVCADTLTVGYRATRQIMETAWRVLGHRPQMASPRDGDPVEIIRTQSHEETMNRAYEILKAYLEARPNALVGVVCRYKADADRVFEDLKTLGLTKLRRHERDDFSFQPGAIVTNAHQIKGLEFSAVLVVNPDSQQYRDNRESRMLLHVVLTRAADRLWLIGHQPMAYGIDS